MLQKKLERSVREYHKNPHPHPHIQFKQTLSLDVAEMVAQMALGCQRVFEDVIIDSDDGDDAQIDEEEEGEDDDVHNDEHEEADEDPFAFISVDDGSSQPVLSVPPPLVGDSVGKTCANPPARMTYSVNEDEFNTYTPIFTKICSFCNALRLPNETSDTCCATGKVGLTKKWFKIPPAEIREIYKDAFVVGSIFFG